MTYQPDQFAIGVDIGQTTDYTALSVLKRVPRWTGEVRTSQDVRPDQTGTIRYHSKSEWFYEDQFYLGFLERMPLYTPYQAIADKVESITRQIAVPCHVVVDQTGVGRPVVEMMHHLPIVPVTITFGHGTSCDSDGWKVAKKVLISNAQVLLQNGRLLFGRGMRLIDPFVAEMAAFRVKAITTKGQTFEAREGQHDDLVLSVCLAAWWASRTKTGWLPYGPHDGWDPQTKQVLAGHDELTAGTPKIPAGGPFDPKDPHGMKELSRLLGIAPPTHTGRR